jgi:hypothetical protein
MMLGEHTQIIVDCGGHSVDELIVWWPFYGRFAGPVHNFLEIFHWTGLLVFLKFIFRAKIDVSLFLDVGRAGCEKRKQSQPTHEN